MVAVQRLLDIFLFQIKIVPDEVMEWHRAWGETSRSALQFVDRKTKSMGKE
jgi:hypothetical protein